MEALPSLNQLLLITVSSRSQRRNEIDSVQNQAKISRLHDACDDEKETTIMVPNEEESMALPGIKNQEFEGDPFIRCAMQKLTTVVLKMYSKYRDSIENKTHLFFCVTEMEEQCAALAELSFLIGYTWEQLNVGHWKSLSALWRKLYSCLSILKISLMVLQGLPDLEIIHVCDMGLLMGEPICGNALCKIGEELSLKIVAENSKLKFTKDKHGSSSGSKHSEQENHHENKMAVLKNKTQHEFIIDVSEKPSLEAFLSTMKACTPVKLLNIADHWPAVGKWSVEYIHEVAGFRTVPVEVGQKYTAPDWTQKIMTIGEFIETYMRTTSSNSDQVAYIAQYNLFNQLPQLAKDIRIPDYCSLESESGDGHVEINAWFGPANTISPTHYDPKHNILVQVFGSKIIRLFPPSESSKLNPYDESSILFNTSQLDIEQDDLFQLHPKAGNLKHCDVTLNAKDALFIPPKWWHYVKSLSPSFSVSFWFE